MWSALSKIMQALVFPGLLFTAAAGLATAWVDRKVTARVQMRVGPPPLQPLYDVIKLMVKETCLPEGAPRRLFLAAPLIGLAGVTLASTILWRAMLFPGRGFAGDLVVVLYLLTMPAIATVLGAFASRNPLAALGGSREMKLVLAYELPLVLAVMVAAIQTGSLRLDVIMDGRAPAYSLSGLVALLVAVLCMQAKLTLVPFDAPEAETELAGGAYIEYGGPPLAMIKLTRAMMLFTMPVFLIAVLWGGIGFHRGWLALVSVPLGIVKYILLVVLIVLIRNTAPRVRIDQAVSFFWGPVTAAALAAVGFAFLGW